MLQYNGCRWRGGVLRVEKARPDFKAILREERQADEQREAAAAEAAASGQQQHVLPPADGAVLRMLRPGGKKVTATCPYEHNSDVCATAPDCTICRSPSELKLGVGMRADGEVCNHTWAWLSDSVSPFQEHTARAAAMAGSDMRTRKLPPHLLCDNKLTVSRLYSQIDNKSMMA